MIVQFNSATKVVFLALYTIDSLSDSGCAASKQIWRSPVLKFSN